MSPVSLRIARHPPVVPVGLCYGRTEVAIQGTAERAATELARTFDAPLPSVVWSSPSRRCAEVVHALALHWGTDVRTDARLHEIDFGAWEGRSWHAIEHEDRAAHTSWMSAWKSEPPPGGESLIVLERRVRSWLLDLSSSADATVVAHAGVIRCLRVVLDGISWEEAMGREVPYLHWERFASTTPLAARSVAG